MVSDGIGGGIEMIILNKVIEIFTCAELMTKSSSESISSLNSDNDSDIFEVNGILSHIIGNNRKVLFQVRWKGFGEEDDTYEPVENLTGCWKLVESYCDTTDDLKCYGVGKIIVLKKDNSAQSKKKQIKEKKSETEKDAYSVKDKNEEKVEIPTPKLVITATNSPQLLNEKYGKSQKEDIISKRITTSTVDMKNERTSSSHSPERKYDKGNNNNSNQIEIPTPKLVSTTTDTLKSSKKKGKKNKYEDRFNKRIEIPSSIFAHATDDFNQPEEKQKEDFKIYSDEYKQVEVLKPLSEQYDNRTIQTNDNKSKKGKKNNIPIEEENNKEEQYLKAATKKVELLDSFLIQKIDKVKENVVGQHFALCELPDQELNFEIPISYVQFLAPEQLKGKLPN